MDLPVNEKHVDQIEERIKRLQAVILRARQCQKSQLSYTPIQITNFAGEVLIKADNVLAEGSVDQIEERIKHLQAVILRNRPCQKSRLIYTSIQTTNFAGEVLIRAHNVQAGDRSMEEKMRLRKASYLVAKALGMETHTNEVVEDFMRNRVFDCNICFNMAKDPVLTFCGHLFCWPCFYQLPYANADARQCPVCVGEVHETDLIPIYGNAAVNGIRSLESNESDSGSKIPPRPNAPRIESTRQQCRSRGAAASANQDMLLSGNIDELEYF